MNNLKIIVCILFIGTLNISCEEADDDNCALSTRVKEITYNRSNHTIAVTSWSNGEIKDMYNLAIDESITRLGSLSDFNFFFIPLDSISIVFDNQKRLFLKKEILDTSNGITTFSNVIDYDSESTLKEGNECERLYEFSFTQKHYNNAENCGGKCD